MMLLERVHMPLQLGNDTVFIVQMLIRNGRGPTHLAGKVMSGPSSL